MLLVRQDVPLLVLQGDRGGPGVSIDVDQAIAVGIQVTAVHTNKVENGVEHQQASRPDRGLQDRGLQGCGGNRPGHKLFRNRLRSRETIDEDLVDQIGMGIRRQEGHVLDVVVPDKAQNRRACFGENASGMPSRRFTTGRTVQKLSH